MPPRLLSGTETKKPPGMTGRMGCEPYSAFGFGFFARGGFFALEAESARNRAIRSARSTRSCSCASERWCWASTSAISAASAGSQSVRWPANAAGYMNFFSPNGSGNRTLSTPFASPVTFPRPNALCSTCAFMRSTNRLLSVSRPMPGVPSQSTKKTARVLQQDYRCAGRQAVCFNQYTTKPAKRKEVPVFVCFGCDSGKKRLLDELNAGGFRKDTTSFLDCLISYTEFG